MHVMKNNKQPVSICIAYFEGQEFIEKQLISLHNDLNASDQIILVNDSPWIDLSQLRDKFPLLEYYENSSNIGFVASFSKAISLAKNNIIFFCDQDDLWVKGKREKFVLALEKNCLAISSYYNFDCKGNMVIINQPNYSNRLLTLINILLGKYPLMGCAMAINKNYFSSFLKIPNFVRSHDIYFGIVACFIGKIVPIDEPLLLHRLHPNNVSNSSRPFIQKIKSRIWMLRLIIYLTFRRTHVS